MRQSVAKKNSLERTFWTQTDMYEEGERKEGADNHATGRLDNVDWCNHARAVRLCGLSMYTMLGAICGSAQSMDCAAQSVDPYIAQESMDCAGICGSRLLARSTDLRSAHRLAAYAAPVPESHFFELILLDSLHYMIGQLFPTYQSGAKRTYVITVLLRQVPALSACREAEFRRRRSVILFRGL